MKPIRPYMAWIGDDPSDWAVLVFAASIKDAKPIAWNECTCLGIDAAYTDLRVRKLKPLPHIFAQADQVLLSSNTPHVIDSPITCKNCKLWGEAQLNEQGICEDCEAVGYHRTK